MNTFINNEEFKKKFIFIMGATGTGKSHLYVDLATHFRGEIVKLNWIQTSQLKIFVCKLLKNAEHLTVSNYCWRVKFIDVEQSLLNHSVDMRVDQMFKAVDEVRQIFFPDAYYTKGI
uniref:Uncharacterized protein n=1 Tax=Solanum lycopersicum TaxID=4081 RepID=A0A3Q7JMY3_SOLLC